MAKKFACCVTKACSARESGMGSYVLFLLWFKRRGDFHSPGLWPCFWQRPWSRAHTSFIHITGAERQHALAVLAVLVAKRVDEDAFFDAQAWKDYHAATHHVQRSKAN